ncbi:MAG: hypothetical protein WCB48_04695 [Casimicrobiaceae bacterium]
MDTHAHAPTDLADTPASGPAGSAGARRALRHALALLVATAVAWLIFTAYRQPGFILDVAGLRLC